MNVLLETNVCPLEHVKSQPFRHWTFDREVLLKTMNQTPPLIHHQTQTNAFLYCPTMCDRRNASIKLCVIDGDSVPKTKTKLKNGKGCFCITSWQNISSLDDFRIESPLRISITTALHNDALFGCTKNIVTIFKSAIENRLLLAVASKIADVWKG